MHVRKIKHQQQQGDGEYACEDKEGDMGFAISRFTHGSYAQTDAAQYCKRTEESDEPEYFDVIKSRVEEFCITGITGAPALSGKASQYHDADNNDGRDYQEYDEQRHRKQQGPSRLTPADHTIFFCDIAVVRVHDAAPVSK